MTAIIVPLPTQSHQGGSEAQNRRIRLLVNIQADVLDEVVAWRMAHEWLHENVSHLLSATTPEVVLGERLFWRYEVMLGLPNLAQPGSGALYRIGQIRLDADTGEIQDADALVEELRVHVTAATG